MPVAALPPTMGADGRRRGRRWLGFALLLAADLGLSPRAALADLRPGDWPYLALQQQLRGSDCPGAEAWLEGSGP